MRLPCAACATAWSKPARPAQAARTAAGFSPPVSSPVLFGWLRMREQDSGMPRDSCGLTVPCNPVAAFPFLRVARRSAQGLQTMMRSGRADCGIAHSSFPYGQHGRIQERGRVIGHAPFPVLFAPGPYLVNLPEVMRAFMPSRRFR